MRRVNKNKNFKKEDFEEGFNRVTQKCKITPTEDKIGLIQYLQTFAILKICYYMKILIYLNYNWVPGLPEQAGAELGQAQLDLSSLTQLEKDFPAIS